jgi:hypothetical protein
MQDVVKDHREDIAEFKKEANSGQEPDFKAFASNTLPRARPASVRPNNHGPQEPLPSITRHVKIGQNAEIA